MDRIYMDNAATTMLKPQILSEMLPYFSEIYGNPSSIHSHGREAKKGIDKARAQVAKAINALPEEILFTGGGTEGDNTAIIGAALANQKKGRHLITSQVEHHAVLHTFESLEKQGFEVTYLPADEYGMISVRQLEEAIREDTTLVSIMLANNEVGTIMPVKEIGALTRAKKILFHTDAVQAIGQIPVDVKEINADLLTLTAHKFHGPKGVGALYIRKGVRIPPYIIGGAQEKNRRAGTENVPGIVGLGAAIELAAGSIQAYQGKVLPIRDALINGIPKLVPDVKLNGHPTERLPNNVNFSIKYIEGEAILLMLDINGISASSGSACTSGSLDPSHVLLAMGMTHEIAHGSLRLSLSDLTEMREAEKVLEVLPKIVERLRSMSPLYKEEEK